VKRKRRRLKSMVGFRMRLSLQDGGQSRSSEMRIDGKLGFFREDEISCWLTGV
jgi:hypothetical protein